MVKALVVALALVCASPAIEIRSGPMLGRDFDPRAFYVRGAAHEPWRKTYSGPEYLPEARGKLMNIRLPRAPFENDAIGALDFYKSHGVLMINVSLQSADVSAFRPNGTLDEASLKGLDRLLNAANQRGMVVNLTYFHQDQDEIFERPAIIHAAARNTTDWLIEHRHANVLIDVADEFDLGGDRWDFRGYIPQNIIPLMDEVRERFRERNAPFIVPVSVSTDRRMRYPAAVLGQVDAVLLHGNTRDSRFKALRAAQLKDVRRPVLMTGDDNGRESTVSNLQNELASCDVFFHQAAGWGYTPWVRTRRFPFELLSTAVVKLQDDMPETQRDVTYFHTVLDHIAALTLKAPPLEGKAN